MKLNIALDFDDTFTADPELWRKFVLSAEEAGHTVWMVTARRDTADNRDIISKALGNLEDYVQVIFANLKSKMDHCDSIGLKINIWIDDSPHAVVFGV